MSRKLLALVALTVLASSVATPAHAGPDITGRLLPPSGAWLGAWVGNRYPNLDHYEEVEAFESQIGRKLNVSQHYRPWDNQWWGEEQLDLENGRIPLISWTPAGTTAAEINSGSQDALITEKADAIKALGGEVFLRFAYEMDQPPGSIRYIGPPSEFITAWRRVHGIFQDRGATNAVWVWCAIAWNFTPQYNVDAKAYYPGDAYVDWIAADGYNWYPEKPDSQWKSFKDIFAYFYEWAAPKSKPVMIAETGAQEDPATPGRKGGWITATSNTLKEWPDVKAFMYFHSKSPKGYDFWVDTSPSALDKFKAIGEDPYFNPPS